MLSGYLIEKFNDMGTAYTYRRLCDEAHRAGVNLTLIGAQDSYIVENGSVQNKGSFLEKRDFVINRYKWGLVKDLINDMVYCSYNKLEPFKIYINKFNQLRQIKSNFLRKPSYVLASNQISYHSIVDQIGMPFVAKGLESSMGREVFLVKNENEYKNLTNDTAKEWLCEEYISSSKGCDMRLFAVRGEAVACMRRTSNDDFRANVALGAKVEPVAINEELRVISQEIWQQTKLDVVGIDILFGTDCLYFCEINVMPGLLGIEQSSRKNIARLIINSIITDLNEHN